MAQATEWPEFRVSAEKTGFNMDEKKGLICKNSLEKPNIYQIKGGALAWARGCFELQQRVTKTSLQFTMKLHSFTMSWTS